MDAVKMVDGAIDHVAIAVRSIPESIPLFVDALGGEFLFAGDQRDQGFRFAQFAFPNGGKIELVASLAAGSFVERFVEGRGEGVHHVTIKVPDIARAIEHLQGRGVDLFNVSTDDPDWKEAFIHPKTAHGTLIQLAQSRLSDEEVVFHHLRDHGPDGHRHLRYEDLFER